MHATCRPGATCGASTRIHAPATHLLHTLASARPCRRAFGAAGRSGVHRGGSHGMARASSAAVAAAAAGKRVIALDFDGVVCDSVGESSLSAFKAAALQWPELFQTPAAEAAKSELVEKMRAVRPVVETGYENVVQIRCLYEGVGVQQMLDAWHEMLPAKMQQWGLDRNKLVQLFCGVRDAWIAQDLAGWLAPNRIYPGVASAVQQALAHDEVYIVTTKQAHYTEVLLRDMAGIALPLQRIHSTTLSSEPKAAVLARLAAQHPGASAYVFVEDKLSTLEKVAADPATVDWQLFLVDWGYNTERERASARAHPRISVLDARGFAELMAGASVEA